MGAGGKWDDARNDHGCGTTICHVFTNLEPWALQQWHTFAMDPKYFHVLPHRLTNESSDGFQKVRCKQMQLVLETR